MDDLMVEHKRKLEKLDHKHKKEMRNITILGVLFVIALIINGLKSLWSN